MNPSTALVFFVAMWIAGVVVVAYSAYRLNVRHLRPLSDPVPQVFANEPLQCSDRKEEKAHV